MTWYYTPWYVEKFIQDYINVPIIIYSFKIQLLMFVRVNESPSIACQEVL